MSYDRLHRKGRIIGEDFQGWPMNVLTVGELKQALEGVDDDAEVWVYEDDGMGYCVEPREASDAYLSANSERKEFQIWLGGAMPISTSEEDKKISYDTDLNVIEGD